MLPPVGGLSSSSSHYRKKLFHSLIKSFDQLQFDNRNLYALTIPIKDPTSLPSPPSLSQSPIASNIFFTSRIPSISPIDNPKLITISRSALELLDFSFDLQDTSHHAHDNEDFTNYFCGNKIHPQSIPSAHCYSGHQFGHFVEQLGDGAVIYLGEIINKKTKERWELQLKGAGLTPYSRQGDGRKVLRSSIREFLCSEAMHCLGIPTTRAATLITSDTLIPRDPYYNGKIIYERCSVISRIATNFFRFGSFEIFHQGDEMKGEKSGPFVGHDDHKRLLLDHILSYYPSISDPHHEKSIKYRQLYLEIFHRTIKLLTLWESVGFVHGVLNTDNMSIMGVTLDYGPFAFMEGYDPDFIPNGSDHFARYAWREQKDIVKWNLKKLSEALAPLIDLQDSMLILSSFEGIYEDERRNILRKKFGFLMNEESVDDELINSFFDTLSESWGDFTDSFHALTLFVEEFTDLLTTAPPSTPLRLESDDMESLIQKTAMRLADRSMTPSAIVDANVRKLTILPKRFISVEKLEEILTLIQSNPDEAIKRFPDVNLQMLEMQIQDEIRAMNMISRAKAIGTKYSSMTIEEKRAHDLKIWERWLRNYHRRLLQEFTTQSTTTPSPHHRITMMKQSNPTFILRNWIAFKATEAAESGDYSKIETLHEMLQDPYNPKFSIYSSGGNTSDSNPLDKKYQEFVRYPPDWAPSFTCTCSS